MNAKLSRNVFLRDDAFQRPNSNDLFRSEFCIGSALSVDLMRHGLHVIGANARSIPAKMVKLKPVRDGANGPLERSPMRSSEHSVDAHTPITIGKKSLPYPTLGVVSAVTHDVIPKRVGNAKMVESYVPERNSCEHSTVYVVDSGDSCLLSATTVAVTVGDDRILSHFDLLSRDATPPAASTVRGLSVPNFTTKGAQNV